MHSCGMSVSVSTSQPGWGSGAGHGTRRDRQGLSGQWNPSLTPGHGGRAGPLLQEAFPDEPAPVPVHLPSSLLSTPPHLCSLGQGPAPGEAGNLASFLWTVPLRPVLRLGEGGPAQRLSSGNGMAQARGWGSSGNLWLC